MYTNSKTVKVTLALVTICVTMLCGVGNALAATQWTGTVDDNWFNAGNWSGGIPGSSTDVQLRKVTTGKTIDLFGSSTTVGNVTHKGFGPDRADPAIIQSSGGPATLNFNKWQVIDNKSAMIFKVNMSGSLFETTRKGFTQQFDGMLTLTDGTSGPNQEKWIFNGGGLFANGLDVTYKLIRIGGGPTVDANSVINFGAGPSGALNIGDTGTYNATVDGAMGNGSAVVNISDGGKLVVTASQTGAGTVNVNVGAGGPNSGVTDGYAKFDAPSVNLAILNLNTPYVADTSGAEITTGSEVIVSGTLGGAGAWGGDGTLTVTGTVAPGASIDTITGSNLAIANGGTYELEIADPDSVPGTGWDLIDVDDLTFDNAWILDIVDFGLTRDIDPSEQFVIAMMDTTDFDPANASITTPLDWFVGPNPLFLDNDGNLVLTNVSNIAQAGAAVPEPASIAMWSILGICLAGYGYRRR